MTNKSSSSNCKNNNNKYNMQKSICTQKKTFDLSKPEAQNRTETQSETHSKPKTQKSWLHKLSGKRRRSEAKLFSTFWVIQFLNIFKRGTVRIIFHMRPNTIWGSKCWENCSWKDKKKIKMNAIFLVTAGCGFWTLSKWSCWTLLLDDCLLI